MNSVWPGKPKSAVCSTALAIGSVTSADAAPALHRRDAAFDRRDRGVGVDRIRFARRFLHRQRHVQHVERVAALGELAPRPRRH